MQKIACTIRVLLFIQFKFWPFIQLAGFGHPERVIFLDFLNAGSFHIDPKRTN